MLTQVHEITSLMLPPPYPSPKSRSSCASSPSSRTLTPLGILRGRARYQMPPPGSAKISHCMSAFWRTPQSPCLLAMQRALLSFDDGKCLVMVEHASCAARQPARNARVGGSDGIQTPHPSPDQSRLLLFILSIHPAIIRSLGASPIT